MAMLSPHRIGTCTRCKKENVETWFCVCHECTEAAMKKYNEETKCPGEKIQKDEKKNDTDET